MKRILLLTFILSSFLSAGQLDLQPVAGYQFLTDETVASYLDTDAYPVYGIGVSYLPKSSTWGAYWEVYRSNIRIDDPYWSYTVQGWRYTVALEKRQQFKSIGIIGRLGGNLCKEDYDNDVALGMHLSLGTQFPVYKKLSMNLMIDYNFIVEKIGYYVTCDYSRHQSLLAGKTVHWGGPMIKAGLSYSVFRK